MGCIWVKYLEPAQLFDLLDHLHHNAQRTPSVPVLETIQVVLQALCGVLTFNEQSEELLVDRLPQLLSFKSTLRNSPLFEKITALAIEASLPIGLDGCPPSSACSDLVSVIRRSTNRWYRRGHRQIDVDLHSLLTQPIFSDSTVKIITNQLYQLSTSSHKIVAEWLTSDRCSQRSSEHLIPVLHAFFDSGSYDRAFASTVKIDVWLPFIPRITHVIVDKDTSSDLRLRAEKCLLDIISSSSTAVLDLFAKELKAISKKVISVELLSFGTRLGQRLGSKTNDLIGLLADQGIQWCIDQFADELDTEEARKFTRELSEFVLTSYCTFLTLLKQHRCLRQPPT